MNLFQSEEALDEVLANALFKDPSFASWFLEQLNVADSGAICEFCRSDNPWSRVTLERPNALTGALETLVKDCETDVLAVFKIGERRLALHIENKVAGGSFTPMQPELYEARKTQWVDRPKLGSYSEAVTVLVAPQSFYAKHEHHAKKFDHFVSHERIAERLPDFAVRS